MEVKNILEVLEGIKVIAVPVKKVLEDGKVNLEDLPHLMSVLKEHQKLIDAIAGVKDIPAEVKDIDAGEAALIAGKVMEVIKAVKEA